ncbi:hypothetical protein [Pedobacter sp. ASV28]|uniref:hypothetical protein n=1 Tax=Pedobacter sp. ASV28 TaxID=2795123 RepID=UPI0018EBB0A5|nr:hypothetical protein [Pedobacter sp. ASV28]
MFRKTHFKPKKALFGEIAKEFATYFSRFGNWFACICARYPKPIFSGMLACMLVSGVLAFTVMRVKREKPVLAPTNATSPVADGFGQIMDAGQSLKSVLALQNQVNTILHKDSLTGADSAMVKDAIMQLEAIHKQLNVK